MASIFQRSPYSFRVLIRRKGKTLCKTFETRREAEEWARITEGQGTGDEFVDRRVVKATSLADAYVWMLTSQIPNTPNAKKLRAKLSYWQHSDFSDWSLASIYDWSLIEWRRRVLDEDSDDPEPECSPQRSSTG